MRSLHSQNNYINTAGNFFKKNIKLSIVLQAFVVADAYNLSDALHTFQVRMQVLQEISRANSAVEAVVIETVAEALMIRNVGAVVIVIIFVVGKD